MEWIYLDKLTDEKVSYRYYPENGEEYGIVALVRKTGELIHEKVCPDILSNYYCHAWRRLEKYQRDNNFPEKDLIVWW